MSIKYIGVYTGPSYSSWDAFGEVPGFDSIKEAKLYFHSARHGCVYGDTYRENRDYEHVLWEREAVSPMPATTEQDVMDLYPVQKGERGTWIRSNEPSHRLSVGERGGVVVDKH